LEGWLKASEYGGCRLETFKTDRIKGKQKQETKSRNKIRQKQTEAEKSMEKSQPKT